MRRSKQAFILMTCSLTACCILTALPVHSEVRVETAVVQPGELIQSVWLNGYVCYAEETPCVSMFSGQISEIYVEEGERVQKGDLLFRLDSKAKEAELALLYAVKNKHAATSPQYPLFSSMLNQQTEAEWNTACERLKNELACTQIRAEQDGIVADILITQGAWVENLSVLGKIRGEEKCIAVTAGIRDAGLMKTGASVFLKKEDQTFPAYVWRMLPADENGSKTVLVKMINEESLDHFQPGERIKAEVITSSEAVPAMIPLSASDADGNVWFVEDGIVRKEAFEWKECGSTHAAAGSEWTERNIILYPETHRLKNGMHARVSE